MASIGTTSPDTIPYATIGRRSGTTTMPLHHYPTRRDPPMCVGDQVTCLHIQNDEILTPLDMYFSTDAGRTWVWNGMLDPQNATQEFRQRGEVWRLVDSGANRVVAQVTTDGAKRMVLRAGMFSDIY